MRDIIKFIFEVILAFILGIATSAIILILWALIIMWPITIPIIVTLSFVGIFVGYVIATRK